MFMRIRFPVSPAYICGDDRTADITKTLSDYPFMVMDLDVGDSQEW